MGVIPHLADPRTGFLLIEYPGYGICEGTPSPLSILENSENAFQALLEQERWNPGDDAIRVLGHSLGGAAALQFAAKHPVHKIVVISTFTTMDDMVRATIRVSLGRLLRHRFNNVASLKAILSQERVPEINIFHGEADRLVPVHMGLALSQLDPGRIKFVAIPGADHNDPIEESLRSVLRP
jgi:pimeloyl-ACP methyl ester carboxylesterase